MTSARSSASRRPIAKKSREDIAALAVAGQIAREIISELVSLVCPGVTTREINARAEALLAQHGATGIFRDYRQGASPPFPGVVCVSINDEAVHGIPGERVIAECDCVTIDLGLRYADWCADVARTVVVPTSNPMLGTRVVAIARLIDVTRDILSAAASMMSPGTRWSSVATMIENRAAQAGYAVVGEFVGHGIGRFLHEAPEAPCYWTGYRGEDFTLEPGMVIAVEPMLTLHPSSISSRELAALEHPMLSPIVLGRDGWTVRTQDASIVCHEEDVIAVTEDGPKILTRE